MPRLLPTFALTLLLLCSFSARTASAAPAPAGSPPVRMMIRLAGPPLAGDTNLKTRDSWTRGHFRLDPNLAPARHYTGSLFGYQNRELSYLQTQGIHLQVIRRFTMLFNGFAAMVPQNEVAHLRRLANVAGVVPDRTNIPLDDHSLKLINTPPAWAQLGGSAQAGAGQYIATIDTGIQINNPCFSDKGMPAPKYPRRADNATDYALTNNKVVVARAFGSYPNKQYTAEDVEGHGTFVSSVEACDYNTPTPLGINISGVAPRAYLMSYDVYPKGDDGGGPEDSTIAAFTAAYNDGADVVNYSSGLVLGAGDEGLDPQALAINNETRAGLTVVVAAGNAGPTPDTVSSPGTADGVIAAGATSNDRAVTSTAQVNGPGAVPTALKSIASDLGDTHYSKIVGPAPVAYVGLGRMPGDDTNNPNANDFAGVDLHGKIAVIQRGIIHFEVKLDNAQKAGAIGAIIIDNQHEVGFPAWTIGKATLPAMMVSQADGQTLLSWIQAHPDTTMSVDPNKQVSPLPANYLTDFSSRGYGPGYRIKPDLLAPGKSIYGAAQTTTPGGDLYDPSGFAQADGTSFSAPHVAGGAALMLQRHPTWTPAMVKAVLMETASTSAVHTVDGSTPGVMDVGSGLMDLQAAIQAGAYALPSSLSFGQVSVGYGAQTRSATLNLQDAGAGAGSWTVSVNPLHANPGVQLVIPGQVTLSGAQSAIAVHLSVAASTPIGDYDGYIVLQNGSQRLHLPYFVHVATEAVKAGTVLLVDDTTSLFQPPPPLSPTGHVDVSRYYEQALDSLHRPYTYWDEARQGSPSVDDMKRASAVIYYTGANLNGWAHSNSDNEALDGPLTPVDMTNIREYLAGGGKLFISGMGAALSDPVWTAVVLGAQVPDTSEYDNTRNDKTAAAGMGPPQPSATVDRRQFNRENPWLFTGLKAIDFSGKGDGAGDNVAVNNPASGSLVGVTDLDPYYDTSAGDAPYNGYGQAVLRTTNLKITPGNGNVGMVSSEEPGFKLNSKKLYPGRSVFFSFGFEGINNNTGYATRQQVLQRILLWLNDHPVAHAGKGPYAAGRPVTLRSWLSGTSGVHAAQVQWQVGNRTLKVSNKPVTFTFPHAGTFRMRVAITDSVGHIALSAWTNVTAR